MRTSRLEAFSDGVLAIAITLLVLELKSTPDRHGSLARGLVHQWPQFGAYVVSFMVIGIIWVNHHTIFDGVVRVTRTTLLLNLLLLLFVAMLPFPTALFAEHINDGWNSHVAAATYSAVMVGVSVAFAALWWHVSRTDGLLRHPLTRAQARASSLRFGLGLGVYLATIGMAFINAPVTLLAHFVIAVYYVFDQLQVSPSPAQADEAA